MPWLLVTPLLVLLAVVPLVLVGLRLWRSVKALGREVTVAGRLVGAASEELERLQQQPGSPPRLPDTAGTRPAQRVPQPPRRA